MIVFADAGGFTFRSPVDFDVCCYASLSLAREIGIIGRTGATNS